MGDSVDLVHPDVIEKIRRVIDERGVTDYTLEIESGAAKGDNYLGSIVKAKIEGVDGSGAKTTLHWIVKCAPTVEFLRMMMKVDQLYKREMYIYEKVIPTFRAFQAEKQLLDPFDDVPVFVASHDEPLKETLIMEDMKSVGYVMKDRKLPLDVHHVRLAMKAYAKFHAAAYALRNQKPDEFKPIAEGSKDFLLNDPGFKEVVKLMNGLSELMLSSFDPIKEAHMIEKYRKYSENVFDIIVEAVTTSEANPYCVITHGDSWVNNMLFSYGNKDHPEVPTKICILDWQNARCGSPAFDLSYFLFTCTDKAFRDLHYHSMMKLYYYTLCLNLTEMGSDPEQCLPYEVFQNELKRYSILGVTLSIMVLNMMLSDVGEIPDVGPDSVESLVNFKTKNEGAYKERVRGVIVNAIEYGYFDFLQ